MSKLHFYRKIGKHVSWFADGEGTVSATGTFQVTITDGSVKQGYVYEIRQGTSSSGDLYNCLTGAEKGGTAKFEKAKANKMVAQDADYHGAVVALNAALAASSKIVTINIADEDLRTLKAANYKLCFAKKIAEHDFNVVWQSYTQYLVNNQFSWTPQFQLFGSNTFQEGITVRVSTKKVQIGLGEESVLDSAGILNPPKTGGSDTGITMINEYGSIHPGLNQLSTGITGEQISTPIYVAPDAMVQGEATLTPVETVLVWFQQDIETSTMFSSARSNSEEIDLTTTNEATRLYKGQKWVTP